MNHFFILAVVFFLSSNGVSLTPIDEVQLDDTNVQQNWGYTEVFKDVSLFWWLHMENSPTKPLLIWLGFYSATDTNFNQYGPFTSDLERRNNSLINDFNILFIDSMAGAGFSYVKEEKLYAHYTHETAFDIFMCIKSVFHKFPIIEKSPSYIVADSFFTKIVPEIAKIWYSIGSREQVKYNLKGFVIGSDPYFSLQEKKWHSFENMKKGSMSSQVTMIVDEIDNLRKKELWLEASLKLDHLFDNYFSSYMNQDKPLMLATRNFVNRILTSANSNDLSDLMNGRVKNKLKLSSTWKKTSGYFIDVVMNQTLKGDIKSLYEFQLKTTDLNMIFLNTPMDLKTHPMSDTLVWVDDLQLENDNKWNTQKIPFHFNNKIKGMKKLYKNTHMYIITQHLNPDVETNANFLKSIIVEMMN